jgi:hypothetical protein
MTHETIELPITPCRHSKKNFGIEGIEPSLSISKTDALPLGDIPKMRIK